MFGQSSSEDNPEHLKIIQQLKELFFTTPEWQLRQLCISNDWDLELCVNQLMNVVPKSAVVEQNRELTYQKEFVPRSDKEKQVGDLIKKGYRVMILMRGPPGVGKTHSARTIISNYVDLQPPLHEEDFIFSTDDYFYTRGVYKYNVNFLSEAHDYNQNRVRDKTALGLSPIIVDNTNLKLWEMIPYVKYAVQNGYLIEIMEPKPSWNKCAYKLSQRNIHGVSADKIRHMMDKYERANVSDLMKMLKNTKYTVSLPQLRSFPPIVVEPVKSLLSNAEDGECRGIDETANDTTAPLVDQDASSWGSYETNAPKGQRKKFKSGPSPPKITSNSLQNDEVKQRQNDQSQSADKLSPVKSSSARDVYSLLERKLSNVWKPYEAESIDFWGSDNPTPQPLPSFRAEDFTNKPIGEKSLLDLLRDDPNDHQDIGDISNKKDEDQEISTLISFDRHSVGCANENVAFITLRQIYPNKEISGLWDLFLKCNGDIDWAIDILLKEDELSKLRNDTDLYAIGNDIDSFVCSCKIQPNSHASENVSGYGNVKPESFDRNVDSFNTSEIRLPHRQQRSRFARSNQVFDPTLLEVKENIENCFVLGDDHYSKHLLKIRNFRSGLASGAAPSSVTTTLDSGDNAEHPTEIQEDDDDDNSDDGNSENVGDDMLEMSLGEHLVQQLLENFRNESSLEERIPPSLPLNLKVFMPRSLAKQLYMLWMESAYNHLEEERQKMVREDEDFARLLKHPKYSEYKQSPSNLREMLDIEYAWNVYKRDKEELDQQRKDMEKLSQPSNLAAHLTQMKLCETFPDIPRETLLDIMATTDNNYNETLSILRGTMEINESDTKEQQIDDDGLQQQVGNEYLKRRQIIGNNAWDDNENNGEASWSPDDAKRLALREFEEARNLAAHHCQLRAECYQKANEAIQAGNGGAGIYYSQIANLHKQKIDMYNHRAANCIMNAHKYTQNNPDHLDLHYLHLLEALGCLDLFLDRHITALRLASRNYKYVFIITGRGKHSAGGVSVIKSKVKARLEERSLKWNEVNPGLLKVKVFSSSRHSQNF